MHLHIEAFQYSIVCEAPYVHIIMYIQLYNKNVLLHQSQPAIHRPTPFYTIYFNIYSLSSYGLHIMASI